MNGFSGRGKNGYFHITLSSRIKALSDEFERILKENGVNNIYFIGDHEYAEDIIKHEGSLRCMSNPASVIFGHFGSSYSLNPMPENIYLNYDSYDVSGNSDVSDDCNEDNLSMNCCYSRDKTDMNDVSEMDDASEMDVIEDSNQIEYKTSRSIRTPLRMFRRVQI